MTLDELPWDSRSYVLVKLSNGDALQIFRPGRKGLYDLYQLNDTKNANRRVWWDVDALTAQCILNALLQDPLMQLSDHPER